MEGLKKALVVGGLMTILAGNVIGGSPLSTEWRQAMNAKLASPKSHFTINEEYGYIAKMNKIKPEDFSSSYNMQSHVNEYDSNSKDNSQFERLLFSLHKKMFGRNPVTKNTKLRIRVIPENKWLFKNLDGINDYGASSNMLKYDIQLKAKPLHAVTSSAMHELCHVTCRNPFKRYDEMYAVRGEYAAIRLMAGNNTFLNRFADAMAYIRSKEKGLHGDVWRESEQIIQEKLGTKPITQFIYVNSRGLKYIGNINEARNNSYQASVWLCNVLNNSKRFKKVFQK